MNFRITQEHSANAAIRQAQLRQQQIADLQNQLATGLRINKPSDAPSEWGSLLANKSSVRRMEVDLQNITTVRQRLNQSVSSLTEAGNILVRARELALSAPQSQHRPTLAAEVDRLIDAMLSVANSAEGGLHLYSGTASDRKPFEVTAVDENGRPLSVQYRGSESGSDVLVGIGTTANMLPNGAQIFEQSIRTASTYIGSTGATAGAGTDSARGVGSLVVRHTGTVYAAGNVVPGASSVGGDTIIGPAGSHVLTVQDDPTLGRVVMLNGGAPIPFDATSTDLRVVGPIGEEVYVDMSGVAGAFTGDVDITSNGTLSVDGGATEVAIDFSASQLVTDSSSGEVTVVDSSQIQRTGTDRIEYSGTAGVFDALMQLRDDLRNADDWSTPELVQIMDSRISDVQRAHDQVMEFVGEQAVELSNLETLESRTRELTLVTQEAVIDIENADVADVIVRLQNQQNHLQFIYAATASLSQTSLLDFIR